MRLYAAAIFVLVAIGATPSSATMPLLTKKPVNATPPACRTWAESQDEDALYMWGMRASGETSKEVALMRLTLSCLGDAPPEIVEFGSSAGFDRSFCRKHPHFGVCDRMAR